MCCFLATKYNFLRKYCALCNLFSFIFNPDISFSFDLSIFGCANNNMYQQLRFFFGWLHFCWLCWLLRSWKNYHQYWSSVFHRSLNVWDLYGALSLLFSIALYWSVLRVYFSRRLANSNEMLFQNNFYWTDHVLVPCCHH